MDVMATPKRYRRSSMPARISSRRKSLFGQGIDSPEMSPETYSPPLTSPSSWSESSARTPVKTPIKSLQDGITQLALEKTLDHRIGVITVQTTPTVPGVRALSPDRGVVTPKTFYGKSSPLNLNRNLYDTVKERVRRSIVFAPRANQPFQKTKRSRSSDISVRQRPEKTPRLSPTSKPVLKIKKSKSSEKVERPKVEKNVGIKKEKERKIDHKKSSKPVYNWQFFNSTTPPTSKISSLFKEKSSSVLTPPPSSKKRKKLISPYDMDHLKLNEDINLASDNLSDTEILPNAKRRQLINFKKSATQVEVDTRSREYGDNIAEEIAEDFSEDEVQEGELVKDVEEIIEELNKDVAEVLEDVTEEELRQGSENENKNKLYPIFSVTPSSKQLDTCGRKTNMKCNGLARAGRDNNQLILDVGQKNLREVVCHQCGLLYVKGDAVDEASHHKYHSQYRGLLFQGWKNQRLSGINGLDKIITVKDGDPKHWWQKVKDVLEIVNRELGFPEEAVLSEIQVFMYIKKNKIVGCAVAKPVRYAHRVLPCLGTDAALCSEESYPVSVGISRLWVHPEHKRSGIATNLIDAIRKNYNFVKCLKMDDIAFSSPTEEGRRFAAKYCKREDYLVYTFEC